MLLCILQHITLNATDCELYSVVIGQYSYTIQAQRYTYMLLCPQHKVYGHIDVHTSVRLYVRTSCVRNSSYIEKGTVTKLSQIVYLIVESVFTGLCPLIVFTIYTYSGKPSVHNVSYTNKGIIIKRSQIGDLSV